MDRPSSLKKEKSTIVKRNRGMFKKGVIPKGANVVKPGEVRNPLGRPKKEFCMADILDTQSKQPVPFEMRIKLQGIVPDDLLKNGNMRQVMLYRTYREAVVNADAKARDFIAERMEGKVSQPMSIEGLQSNNTEDLMQLLSANVKALQDASNNS